MKSRLFLFILAALAGACATQGINPPSGAQTFATNCASCHGPQGEGDGPVASVILVTVPNLRTLSQRNDGVFPAEAVASYIDGRDLPEAHGARTMPVWGDVFEATTRLVPGAEPADVRIERVIAFLRELQYP